MDQELKDYLDRRFTAVDQRFTEMDQRFDSVDQRFAEMDQRFTQRFDSVDQRFDSVDQRFDSVDQRFTAVDQRFTEMDQRITERIDAAKASMFQRMDDMAATLEESYRDTQTEVLKAVYSMGVRLETRAGAQEAVITSIQQRQASVEARLLEIEMRLHMPPAA
jgi:predicted transcriptional regulator